MISVIVPVYNCAPYLEKCLDSILAQSYSDFELILIDDGSTDGSAEICKRYAVADSRVVYKRQSNQGVSVARNAGLALSRGEYICFFDSDDTIKKDMLKVLMRGMNEHESCELVVCGIEEHYPEGNVKSVSPPISGCVRVADLPSVFPDIFKTSLINSCANKMYRKQHLKVNQDTKLCIGEDLVFNLDYIKTIKNICFIQEDLYIYHMRHGSLNRSYRADLMDQLEAVYIQKMKFCKALGFGTVTKQQIATTYMTLMIYALVSMYGHNSNASCRAHLKTLMQSSVFQEALKLGVPEKNYQQLLYLLFKLHLTPVLDLLFRLRAWQRH